MIWAMETKDGEPRFAHVERDVYLDYFALLDRNNKKSCKPEPVPYGRLGQQEMWAGIGAEL